ncbi:FAD synthase-like [Ptychodera flava]|uniref:FAD synthase-like n=1 Tax=Ptychodera flava TaxID=63121 RepID=UPI00396AA17B
MLLSLPTTSFRRLASLSRHFTGSRTMSTSETTAGIIIIGDEILKGHTQDTNSFFLCKQLYSLGVKVERVSVIADSLAAISKEISEFSSNYTHVITAGGIGPTHDDITFEGAAKAFNEQLVPHPTLVELCRKYFGQDAPLDSPKLKMAYVPSSAELHFGFDANTGERSRYPVISAHNVFMFPGIPTLLERGFNFVKCNFQGSKVMFHLREIYLNSDEVSIAPILNEFNSKHKDTIQLGSYPEWFNTYYRVKLTLESHSEDKLDAAHQELLSKLPSDIVVNFVKDPISKSAQQVYSLVQSESTDEFTDSVRNSVTVIEECLDKYNLDEICVGFNGGKDCTALLYLFHAAVKRKHPDYDGKLQALYIKGSSSFPEVERFIQDCIQRYNLKLFQIQKGMKAALTELQTEQPKIKAILMGTRKTDPYSTKLSAFSMTDPDWPQYMRVNPLLHWDYHHVWQFLRKLFIEYCFLYDKGYTSLGSMDNTKRNPLLQYTDDAGKVKYKPAYELEDGNLERHGRNGDTDKKWNKEKQKPEIHS